jgi:Rieske Fe-S protein
MGIERRKGLLWLCGVLTGALAASVLVPVGAVLAWPLRRRDEPGPPVVDVGPAGAFPDGKRVRVALVARARPDAYLRVDETALGSAFVARRGDGYVALGAECPHAGCAVDADGDGFRCPCHDSRFDADGQRLSGPAPRGLTRLDVEIVDGRVKVRCG